MRKNMAVLTPVLMAAMFTIAGPSMVLAQPADNTKINERDAAMNEVTADEQGQSKTDLEITQEIRKAIVADKTLSMYGHNVKVISSEGVVTLKGPVTSIEERRLIEEIASRTVGLDRIRSEMDIVTK